METDGNDQQPDIIFFGEKLPNTFFDRLVEEDRDVVDLVIVMGTSMKVAPVSDMLVTCFYLASSFCLHPQTAPTSSTSRSRTFTSRESRLITSILTLRSSATATKLWLNCAVVLLGHLITTRCRVASLLKFRRAKVMARGGELRPHCRLRTWPLRVEVCAVQVMVLTLHITSARLASGVWILVCHGMARRSCIGNPLFCSRMK